MPLITQTGRIQVTATSAEFGESDKGTPFVKIDFTDAAGDTIAGWVYLSEKALTGSLKTLRDAFDFDGNFETLIAQVTGKPASIVIESENYEGKDRLKVRWINRAGGTSKPLSGDATSFLKRLTATAARIPKEPPRAAAAPARAVAPARPVAPRPAPASSLRPNPSTPPAEAGDDFPEVPGATPGNPY